MTNGRQLSAPPSHAAAALLLISLGTGAAAYGLYMAPHRTWPNLLLNGVYFTSLAVSAAIFLATQRLTGARWSASLRRIPEAFMMALPVAAVLMLALFFGRDVLYPWTRSGAFASQSGIAGKVQYLQVPWFYWRMLAVLLAWVVFAWLMRTTSLDQDLVPRSSLILHRRLIRLAAAFAVIFAVTFSIGVIDWILSLEPEWFSTIFVIYVFAGTFVQGIAAVTLATVILRDRGILGDAVNESQLHDLGKMLFAFATFWAYIWICQYLLIWYGNIPEEAAYYVMRTSGPWVVLFALNVLFNWLIPFCVLLPARAKRNRGALKLVSVALLLGRWVDLYILIMPPLSGTPKMGILELFVGAGYCALLYLVFVRNLAKAALVPVNDPILMADAIRKSKAWSI